MNPNKKQIRVGKDIEIEKWLVTTKDGKVVTKFRYKTNALEYCSKKSKLYFEELEVRELK